MPISADRDLDKTRLALEEWFASRMPEADGVTVGELVVPEGTGFSNETLVLDLEFREAGEERLRPLVVRLQTSESTVFPDLDVVRQAHVMRQVAAHSDVPVPEVLWIEEDPGVVGTPFFVMEKVDGQIPTDVPSYNESGFITELTAVERRSLWESAIEKMARVHRIDTDTAGLGFLDREEDGPRGVTQLLAYLERYRRWALGSRPYPVADRAMEWLRANVPVEPGPVGLCWGDARFSNMIFSGVECVAVLDWEMAVLGPAEQDLGWWLYFDRFAAEGYGVDRLVGLPDRTETLEHYAGLLGREPRDIEFYEILAGAYFCLIMVRVAEVLSGAGLLEDDSDFAVNNPSTDLLTRVLDEYGV